MSQSDFRLPTVEQRTVVIGRTGSGKTQFGAWLLSLAPYQRQPYVIVDYKGDKLLRRIRQAREITLKELPKHPGLYYLKPRPDQNEEMEAWLWKVWAKERIGLFFDEITLVPDPQKGGALRAILTQGRSKRIATVCCTQRPSWISRFVFSEADYFAVLHLSLADDRKAVQHMAPLDLSKRIPEYHARWYDVGADRELLLGPAPDSDTILDTFERRLTPRKIFV